MDGLIGERYDYLLRPVADRRVSSRLGVRPRRLLSAELDSDGMDGGSLAQNSWYRNSLTSFVFVEEAYI